MNLESSVVNFEADIVFQNEKQFHKSKNQIANGFISKRSSKLSADIQQYKSQIQRYSLNIVNLESDLCTFKDVCNIFYKTHLFHIYIQQHRLDFAKHALNILQNPECPDGIYYQNQRYDSILDIPFYEKNDTDSDIDSDSDA